MHVTSAVVIECDGEFFDNERCSTAHWKLTRTMRWGIQSEYVYVFSTAACVYMYIIR